VTISKSAKKIANELIDLGFTDQLVLGKAPALELVIRLQDICNGFEPTKEDKDSKVVYRPLADNPKLDELEELLDEIDTENNQVVVWCSRTNAFDSISARLDSMGIAHVRYSGSESKEQKKEAEEKFQSGEARVFLANQASAAFGLNCLKNCSYVIEYCNDASVERHHQAQHRVLRGQSKTPKFAYQIYVKGSVEERVIGALNVGQELLSSTNRKNLFVFS
jgi:SNF2 family DNA or RNA helicase